nr:2OG-Fe dioxygenase family protein [Rhodoferax sp.]
MALNTQQFQIFDLPPLNERDRDSFRDLALDTYIPVKNRFRRFAQYRMIYQDGDWQFEQLPHRAYVTYSKYNNVAGGIKREYQPLLTDFTSHIRLAAEAIPLPIGEPWQINVHQYRIFVDKERQGVIVPEGVHRDGHEYVFIGVYNRSNINGAEMSLRHADDKDTPFFATTIGVDQGVVFNDRNLWHYVDEIEPIDANCEAYRDTVVVAFSRWADKWYGDDFERRAIGEGRGAEAHVHKEASHLENAMTLEYP